jgi:hypothetical protein
MAGLKLLEAEHAAAARGEMGRRRTAHGPETNDNHRRMLKTHQVPYFNMSAGARC